MKLESDLTVQSVELDAGTNTALVKAAPYVTSGVDNVHEVVYRTLRHDAPRVGAKVRVTVEEGS